PRPLSFGGTPVAGAPGYKVFGKVRALRARAALDRGSVSEDGILKVELGEPFDRLSVLFRVDIVTVVHGLEAGLVPRRIASDQEGMGRVEERDAAAGVARRENDLESIDLLAIV